jgi:hypothetical protein
METSKVLKQLKNALTGGQEIGLGSEGYKNEGQISAQPKPEAPAKPAESRTERGVIV